jgi:beta propeller domain-containing protein
MKRLALAAALLGVLATPAAAAPSPRLHAFPSCKALASYTRAHAHGGPPRSAVQPTVQAPTANTPTAPGTPDQSSGTNVQEPGVDEPDVLKSDNGVLFSVVDGTLRAIDATGDRPQLLSSVRLEGGDAQLLEHDGRVLVITRGLVTAPVPGPGPRAAPAIVAPGAGQTVLTEVDARDPTAMAVVRTLRVNAAVVDARQTGAVARVVLSAAPRVVPGGPVQLPQYKLAYGSRRGGHPHRLVPCGGVLRPPVFDGTGLLTVLTVDLDRGLPPIDSDAVMTSGQVVYASPTSLYVATADRAGGTDVHGFDISDPTRTDYRASGNLPGRLLDQFSLSEQDGRLRAATSKDDGSESRVTVLEEQNGVLVPMGSVGGLGQGQRIYAVRFLGATGYVVTFRQVDPLYVLDLSDPTAPRVAGQLELEGYSSYLHPLGDGLLLGVGQDASDQGRLLGTQLSLFDVSDPANPSLLQHTSLGPASSSDVEYDHHAFLWWEPTGLALVPVGEPSFTGALGFKVSRDGIVLAGRVTHADAAGDPVAIDRSAVVGDRLLTVSSAGVEASTLDGLAPLGWLAFPGAGGGGGSGGAELPVGR